MLLRRRHYYCGGSSTPFRRPIRQEKAEEETTTGIYPTYLSYLWVFAASLAHERLQTLHVSEIVFDETSPAPAHGKLSDEKRY